MNKLNLPPFYIGQKVVYVGNDDFLPKKTLIVNGLHRQRCGCWAVDVDGIKHEHQCESMWACGDCNKLSNGYIITHLSNNGYTVWISSSELRPLEEKPLPLLTFEQIKKEEKEEILILN